VQHLSHVHGGTPWDGLLDLIRATRVWRWRWINVFKTFDLISRHKHGTSGLCSFDNIFFNRVSYIAFMRRWGHRSSALTVFVWQLDGGGGRLNNVSLARLRVMLRCIGEMAADFRSSAMVTANCGCVAMWWSDLEMVMVFHFAISCRRRYGMSPSWTAELQKLVWARQVLQGISCRVIAPNLFLASTGRHSFFSTEDGDAPCFPHIVQQ
jgi:hypothetical protein